MMVKFGCLFILVFLLSCGTTKNATPQDSGTILPDSPPVADKEGFYQATVIDYSEISGCTFLLQLENQKKLQPENLDKSFHKNNLKVDIKFTFEKNPTTCMAGQLVRITEIRKSKNR